MEVEGGKRFEVGTRVVVQKLVGTVRFFGKTEFKEGDWVGIELDEPKGRNDGTVAEVTYFSCAPNHGMFIQPDFVFEHCEDEVAAVTLQSNFRAHLAKKKVKARQAARTWNVLDNHFEEQGLRKGKAVEKATKQLKAKTIVQERNTQMRDSVGTEGMQDAPQAAGVAEARGAEQQGISKRKDEGHDADQAEEDGEDEEDEEDEEMDDMFMGATVEELQQAAADAVEELKPEMLNCINVGDDYDGPHLRFPLRLEPVIDMLEAFKTGKILHLKYFMLLLLHGKNLFDKEGTVQDIEIAKGIKLTVVGDTHGQLQDLFTIFTINGLPSEKNWYLFNGDFVDRGPKGCEIVACMLAFKILFPKCVFLNRGNHEARAQNAWMGFEEELLTKYGHDTMTVSMKPSTKQSRMSSPAKKARKNSLDRAAAMRRRMNEFGPNDRLASLKLYMLCQGFFDSLPLCALVQSRVFVCHGGLFRNDGVTLDQIRAINRKREPPLEGRSIEDRLYEDLLWSDPRPTATYPRPLKFKRPSDRGAGCEFGPTVTNRFCGMNQIALVVRSHECVPEGFEVLHNGRLITIFSASRYCGTQTNKGAFIAFGPDLQPEIQQFYAHPIQKGSFLTDEEREQMLERDAIKMIIENICDKRLDLYWYFTQNDTKHTGRVTRVEWATALANVLGLDLPFLHYQGHLAEIEPDGNVNYTKFLSRFQIQMRQEDMGWQEAIVRRICEKLFSLVGADLEGAYKKFDTNDDGKIEYEEFVRTLKQLNVGLTDQQIFELMRSVDVDDDAHINFKEFAERFEVTFTSVHEEHMQQTAMPPQVGNAGAALGAGAAARSSDSANQFRDPRTGRSASMRELEEKTRAEMPNAPISPRSKHRMKLDWNTMDAWTMDNLKTIVKAIFRKTDTLREAFKSFDRTGKKYIDMQDFVAAMTGYLELSMSETDAEKLFRVIDTNDSGRVNYLEFIDAFRADDRNPRAASWKHGVVQQVANVLYQNRIHLKAAFRMFDVDGNGTVTAQEFQEGMQTINELLDKPLTTQQIDELRRSLDRNGDGTIDYKEFFQGLSISDTASAKGLLRKGSSYMDLSDPMYAPAAAPGGRGGMEIDNS
ncbi:Serine/threonine-protein phosphatase with EF-hands 1 (PPEF-1) (DRES10) (Protein phosphatase with EF calcium-binding domain) (PPEF) [Durusdinium trenchii]|uniref:Serine/threonine-protein phosphatase n=1 Tax=Durusdinium trenchii TaxID=1381693 RepID=A0ABP0K5T3_9DINO